MPAPDTLDAAIRRAASVSPDAPALFEEEQSLSYGELEARVASLSAHVAAAGIGPGRRFGILSGNSPLSVSFLFAALRAGAVAVPLNHTLSAEDLALEAADCGLWALWAEPALEKKAAVIRDRVRALRVEAPSGPVRSASLPVVRPEEAAVILYTSGSTGRPLGVTLSHRNLLENARSAGFFLGLKEEDRVCLVLPLYYIYGLSVLLSHFICGASVILENRFSYPQVVLDEMEARAATGFSGVPSHYAILLDQTDFVSRKLPSLRYFTQAGDAMPPRLTRRLVEAFPSKKLFLMYGQTEASPRLSYLAPERAAAKPASVGKPVPGVTIRIAGDDGEDRPPGIEGEILAKGAGVMLGYWNRPEETAAVLCDGWLKTGDIGRRDADGDLFITGRKKNMMKTGGHRFSPLEIERVASEHSLVRECAAVPVPDELLGERLVLYVAAADDSAEREVGDFLKKKLPSYKWPSKIVVLRDIPKNGFGKINRVQLAAYGGNLGEGSC